MKKIIGLILIALLPAAFMAGCGSSTPTSSSPVSNNPTPTPNASVTASVSVTPSLTATSTITATPAITSTPINTAGPASLNTGAAGSFAVLASSSINNDGESVCGSVGEFPGTSSPGTVPTISCGGTSHIGDATANTAMSAIFAASTGAYSVGMAMTGPTLIPAALGSGQSLAPGFYAPASGANAFTLSGILTLDNSGGNSNNVYIFSTTAGSPGTISAAANSQIVLVNVLAANVFWLAGTSITLGGASSFAGNLMANTTIIFGGSATLEGHAYSNTAITFNAGNIITNP